MTGPASAGDENDFTAEAACRNYQGPQRRLLAQADGSATPAVNIFGGRAMTQGITAKAHDRTVPWPFRARIPRSASRAGTPGLFASAGIAGLGLVGWQAMQRLRAIDLRGQVVLITGSSRGLGFAMAQEFARQGARLVICARDEQELEQARQALVQLGAEVLAAPCDVTQREQVERLVQQAIARFGRVDVLVNNAGIIIVGPIQAQTISDFEEAMAIMYWGPVYATMAVLPQMLARRSGRIVNITSIGGKVSVPHLLPYGSAKFALVGFSEGLRAELAREGISVVTVVPGLMRTGSHVNAFFKGNNAAEYTWFSLGATLPITAMSARRAAQQIVRATRYGNAEVVLSSQAQLLARFHGLFPGLTAGILGIVNRFLPKADGIGQARRSGKASETPISRSFLTALGRRAAQMYQQYVK
jgi:NAD(P)-dependent dehydrogenase (short-subunit alcohol dehydrogenase family)